VDVSGIPLTSGLARWSVQPVQDSAATSETTLWTKHPWHRAYVNYLGRRFINFLHALYSIGAFALITLGVIFTKFTVARAVIRPLIARQLFRSGLTVLPMILFLALALGLLVIGQTVSLLSRVGATQYLGVIMVTAIVRELGPLLTAVVVLLRTGTGTVVELGTIRAQGEVEALEALGIDPVHYLVVPRVIGIAVGVFSLTIYLIIGALLSGYLWAFLQDVPLLPGDYFRQIAGSLTGLDFVIIAAKTVAFGGAIAIVTCYHGLAQPLRSEEIARATVRAVAQAVIACVLVDALFIVAYLMV
jgi:phospholipid/cholesterol/gamma-HCH transport system permease protein